MQYISTRNTTKIFSFKDTFLNGLAADGGLYVPKQIQSYSIQDLEKLKNLSLLNKFNLPILVGLSRKSFVKKKFGSSDRDSLNGTIELNKIALDKEKTKSVLNFLEALEEDDDVQYVYANLEINSISSVKALTT